MYLQISQEAEPPNTFWLFSWIYCFVPEWVLNVCYLQLTKILILFVEKCFGCSRSIFTIIYLKRNYFHQQRNILSHTEAIHIECHCHGAGWQQSPHCLSLWRQLSPCWLAAPADGAMRISLQLQRWATWLSDPCLLGSRAGLSLVLVIMQGSPRRRSAVSIFSNFFQGRRHSSSDPLLRIIQRRRSSVVEVLSSSTHRVMVAISSLSPEELDATFPEKKSKVVLIKTVGSSVVVVDSVNEFIHFCCVDRILYIHA